MMKRVSWIGAALAAASVISISGVASASSHREAPYIANDPAADNTDLYAWVEGSNLVILANYIPLEEPAGGPNFHTFSDDVLYEVHIARGPNSLDDAVTYQIRFKTKDFPYVDPSVLAPAPAGGNEFFSQIAVAPADFAGGAQTYDVRKIEKNVTSVLAKDVPVVPPNIGHRTNALVYGVAAGQTYEDFAMGAKFKKALNNGEGTVWAGPRDDGFFVDLGAIFDLAGLQSVLKERPARDDVAGYNVHTIALQIPLNVANGGPVVTGAPNDAQTIGVWASASRRKVTILRKKNEPVDDFGPWVQISRLGLPLINEAVIGLQDKDNYNRTKPKDDLKNFGAYILHPILVRDAKFAGFYDAGGPLAGVSFDAMKTNRTDIVSVINLGLPQLGSHMIKTVGDVLRVDLGTTSGFPNGRKVNKGTCIEEDVTDTALSLILTGLAAPVPDGVGANDKKFRNDFPYLASPWAGNLKTAEANETCP
ncbi:MAG TPA: DUF4331 domain-containing protein [Polyangiaceae bacterium]|jgi:hypothetical protein|nr:DUF4331 domain-containing protein [Polyangiaceae bacterium]